MKTTIIQHENYSEAIIEDMPIMTIAEINKLTEDLCVDILVF